jgi:hypothetical protein
MPNGKPGDHPFTDIVVHGQPVYSVRADALVREIARLGGRRLIEDLLFLDYNPFTRPDPARLEAVLAGIRDRLRSEPGEGGRKG